MGIMRHCKVLILAASVWMCVLVNAQPSDWPLMPKVLAKSAASTLRGSAQWTPASSVDGEQLVNPQIEKDFLMEVQAALGHDLPDGNHERFMSIADSLRPMFASLDKNEYGNLGHTAVRYALHRLFVARHGWLIKGLDPAGQHFNSSSPVHVFAGKVPVQAQGLLEQRLGGTGFGIQELAVFAALLESLISEEAAQRLVSLFKIFSLPLEKALQPKDADLILTAYLSAYILGLDLKKPLKKRSILKRMEFMSRIYTGWEETKQMLREIQTKVLGSKKVVTLKELQAVVVKVGEIFGQRTNADCKKQKERLVGLEADEKGCVPFSKFYKPMLDSGGKDWQFGETPAYLSQLGVVDNSDPSNQKVMIPNYLNAASNCIAASEYYYVCCIDECQSLLGQIEKHIQGPNAPPRILIDFVSLLPSSTESANRTLSASQKLRLQKIAEKHGGEVPIHGRLFMQWLHNIYPRECAYPHLSGTTKSMLATEWSDVTGNETTATMEQMKALIQNHSQKSHGEGQCGRWQDDEELFVSMPAHRRSLGELETDVHTWVAAFSVALVCALAVVALVMLSTMRSLTKSTSSPRAKRGFVVV